MTDERQPVSAAAGFRALREYLEKPPSAVLLGVETRELSHNRFFHYLVRDSLIGPALVRAIADRVGGDWAALRGATLSISPRYQLRLPTGRIPDEVFVVDDGAHRRIAIVEIKVEAPDGRGQLHDYLATWAEHARGDVPREALGLLLRFTTHRVSEDVAAALHLEDYVRILKGLPQAGGELVTGALLADYLRSCRYLLERDRLLLKDPQLAFGAGLSQDPVANRWWTDNWRWACERYCQAVEVELASRRPALVGERTIIGRDPNGAFLDFGFGRHADGPTERVGSAPLAEGFFKLRLAARLNEGGPPVVEARLEAHTLTSSYPKKPPTELDVRVRLEARIRALRERLDDWQMPPRPASNRRASACALRTGAIAIRRPSEMAHLLERLSSTFLRVVAAA